MELSPRVITFDRIDSTSAYARREIASGHLLDAVVIVADTQSQGTGRWSRPWVSPAGGLWMTLALPVDNRRADVLLRGLGLRLGLAMWEGVAAALEPSERERLRLKWPNDLVIVDSTGRAKVAGLLAETVHASATPGTIWLLVGVGVNANFDEAALKDLDRLRASEGRPATAARATSLRSAFGREVELVGLREALVRRLCDRVIECGLGSDTLAGANSVMVGLGERAAFTLADGSVILGRMEGLDAHDGLAIVALDDGSRIRCAPQSIQAEST